MKGGGKKENTGFFLQVYWRTYQSLQKRVQMASGTRGPVLFILYQKKNLIGNQKEEDEEEVSTRCK